MVSDKLFLIGVVVLLLGLGVLGVIGAYQSRETKQATQPYSTEDTERPRVQLSETNFDLDTMGVKETRERKITVTNVGEKPLVVSNFATSCDCTFARMEIGERTSPRFSMHDNPAWSGTIEPGQSGTMTIIYDPKVMPVQGRVERAVLFETNDPESPRVTISFTAIVE